MKYLVTPILLLILVVAVGLIIDKETHEWHPIGPNVKFGTLLTVEGEEDEPLVAGTDALDGMKPYVKKTFTWRSNEINEDTITWTFIGEGNMSTISATIFDFGPDANAWVRFDWCSRHGEVRAVRVE
jgi:hypothetical protein